MVPWRDDDSARGKRRHLHARATRNIVEGPRDTLGTCSCLLSRCTGAAAAVIAPGAVLPPTVRRHVAFRTERAPLAPLRSVCPRHVIAAVGQQQYKGFGTRWDEGRTARGAASAALQCRLAIYILGIIVGRAASAWRGGDVVSEQLARRPALEPGAPGGTNNIILIRRISLQRAACSAAAPSIARPPAGGGGGRGADGTAVESSLGAHDSD